MATTQNSSPTPHYKRVHTPTLIQMEAVECGAAALGIVLHYYGLYATLEELREKCGISRDGSKASYIARAGRGFGLEVKGLRKEPKELFEIKLPFVIFWNFNHFVVIEGFAKDGVFLNDPAAGPRKVSNEEFDQSFTGVVLAMEPGPDFKKRGSPSSTIKSLKSKMSSSWGALTYCILLGFGMVIPGLAAPVFSKLFLDRVLIDKMTEFVLPLLGGMIFASVLKAFMSYVQNYYLIRLENKLSLTMSSVFFWHILKLPYTFFTQRYSGDIASRVQINDEVAEVLSREVVRAAIDIIMVVFYAALMFMYSVPLTLLGISFAAINFLTLRFVSRSQTDANMRLSNEQGKLMSSSISGLYTIETLKASGTESDFFSRWAGCQAKVANATQELSVTSQFIGVVPSLLSTFNTAVILLVGSNLVLQGEITLGTLVAFQALMGSFLDPFNSIMSMSSSLKQLDGGLRRLDDVLNYKKQEPKTVTLETLHSPTEVHKLTGMIELKDVTFGYNLLEAPLIENFNLVIKPGQRVAFVGGSGSGKSTLAKLLTGLFEPWSGEILFDGKKRDQIPDEILSSSISVVDQDIFMFEGTIRDNITMWDTTLPLEEVILASKDSCIHDDVTIRPDAYNSIVEEGGRNFSGGQRQRLEIARSLVSNPAILVMDEATSALDPTTEKIIDENVRRRGCSCVIVAHRLSTIRDCDEIIVLQNGKVVERGTHETMKEMNGAYASLISAH